MSSQLPLLFPKKLFCEHPIHAARDAVGQRILRVSSVQSSQEPCQAFPTITKLLLMKSPYKALPNLRHSNVAASPAALPSPCCALPGAASPKTPRYCSWCLACCLQPSLPLQITVSSTLRPHLHTLSHTNAIDTCRRVCGQQVCVPVLL